ncbi:MAG: HetP family heterocyst commitment protein [Xenococcaceae cyanobacterium MO_188.B19]|nr:HetP family heterocyst commitment protein [Xenococcaceae cyanobacterium MO_188.B19]
MSQHLIKSQTQLNKVIDPSKFELIVSAISSGKYSWACLLILRFTGYNPLHYIPYRTYSRLMKNNSQKTSVNQLQENYANQNQKSLTDQSTKVSSHQTSYQINDLSYSEIVPQSEKKEVHGGNKVCVSLDWDLSQNNFDFLALPIWSCQTVRN